MYPCSLVFSAFGIDRDAPAVPRIDLLRRVPQIATIIASFQYKIIVFQGQFSMSSAFSTENIKNIGISIVIRTAPPLSRPRLPQIFKTERDLFSTDGIAFRDRRCEFIPATAARF